MHLLWLSWLKMFCKNQLDLQIFYLVHIGGLCLKNREVWGNLNCIFKLNNTYALGRMLAFGEHMAQMLVERTDENTLPPFQTRLSDCISPCLKLLMEPSQSQGQAPSVLMEPGFDPSRLLGYNREELMWTLLLLRFLHWSFPLAGWKACRVLCAPWWMQQKCGANATAFSGAPIWILLNLKCI